MLGILLIGVRQVGVAQDSRGDGVIDGRPVDVAAVVRLLDDNDALFPEILWNVLSRDGHGCGRGPEIFEPAVGAQVHASFRGGPIRVLAQQIEALEPLREERGLPGVEAIGTEIDVLGTHAFQLRCLQMLEPPDGLSHFLQQDRGGTAEPVGCREKIRRWPGSRRSPAA